MKKLIVLFIVITAVHSTYACSYNEFKDFYSGVNEYSTEALVIYDSLSSRDLVDTLEGGLIQITPVAGDIGHFRILEGIRNMDTLVNGDVLEVIGNASNLCYSNFNFNIGDTLVLSVDQGSTDYYLFDCRSTHLNIIDGENGGSTIDEITLRILGTTTGLNDRLSPQISLFPNPSDGSFQIECNQIISRVEIMDQQGQLIFSEEVGANEFNSEITALPGTYLARIIGEEYTVVKPLVIWE